MNELLSTADMQNMDECCNRLISQLGIDGNIDGVCILGSGWADGGKHASRGKCISYDRIPVLGKTGVDGHSGQAAIWNVQDRCWLAFEGRRHWYEGAGWAPLAFPVYVARILQAGALLLTNAAGGLNPKLQRGSFMITADHINAMGVNPLQGAHNPFWGERFPDQSVLYDQNMRKTALDAARELKLDAMEGVYIGVAGPTYETPAEIRAFRMMGADAIGMSTVPEAILGNACGLRICAVSHISNVAAGISADRLSHSDVIALPESTAAKMGRFIAELLPRLSAC